MHQNVERMSFVPAQPGRGSVLQRAGPGPGPGKGSGDLQAHPLKAEMAPGLATRVAERRKRDSDTQTPPGRETERGEQPEGQVGQRHRWGHTYTRVHAHAHPCTHVHAHVHTHTPARTHVHMCTRKAHVGSYIHTGTHMPTHAHMCITHLPACTHTCTCTHKAQVGSCVHTCACTYTRLHARTHPYTSLRLRAEGPTRSRGKPGTGLTAQAPPRQQALRGPGPGGAGLWVRPGRPVRC